MIYEIKMLRGAQKQLEQLPKADYKAVKAKIDALANNPRPSGCEKLKDRAGYRVRQGNFRIIYDIYDKILTVEVLRIGDRKDIYK
jgi:mRNA interferase RelE/StbE